METTLEGVNMNSWQISDFTKRLLDDMKLIFPDEEISYHFNTIDGWFKELERKGIHYVQRSSGEKFYDSIDLEIAKFIFLRRREKFRLEMVFDMLPERVEVRAFPPENDAIDMPRTYNDLYRKMKADLMKDLIPDIYKGVEERVRLELESEKELATKELPSPEMIKKDKFNLGMLYQKVTRILQDEAANKWDDLPESERVVKAGWFRTIEDAGKKEEFINEYVNKHFENALKLELDMSTDEKATDNKENISDSE